jgi:hypothetical protein
MAINKMKMNQLRAATMSDYQIVIKKHARLNEGEHDQFGEYFVASKIGEGAYGYDNKLIYLVFVCLCLL